MKRIGRREFTKLAGAGMAALSAPALAARAGAAPRKPNIIYIMADDLGYGDLGCFGQRRIKTPRIDQLAKEGVRLTQHYAGSTVCAPSRCCLMTGLHTGHAYVRGNARSPLRPEETTVAALLKRAGYATGQIGKWGLGEEGTVGHPNRHGFDFFYGYLNQVHAHSYYPEFIFRNETPVKLRNEVVRRPGRGSEGAAYNQGGAASKRVDYSHDLLAAEALKFVDEHRDGPFFLYLPFTIPHANNECQLVKQHGMEIPDYGAYKDEDWPEPQKGHAAMISRLDRDVGRLMDKLKTLGLDEHTLVIFTSDNGPHREGGADPDFFDSNGPLRGIKRDLYEGGIRVPTIARWPGRIEAGTTCEHISAFWDLLPTCCDVAGVPAPKGIDGISYLPALLGQKQKKHDYLYWEFTEQGGKQAVRQGDWKAVRLNVKKAPKPLELYNLKDDLGETKNVADQHPEVVAELEKLMKNARTPSPIFKLFEDEA